MRLSRHAAIREFLRSKPDGANPKQIAEALGNGATPHAVHRALSNMPDTYIDRWEHVAVGAPTGVWVAVKVPENCPRPNTGRRSKK